MKTTNEIIRQASQLGMVVPGFNVPYLPMAKPIIQAIVDQDAFALLEVARLELIKFEARSLAAVAEEFNRWGRPDFVRLHLDHVPVIDEDGKHVDYLAVIKEALGLSFQSVMVDGSRLDLAGNIQATHQVVEMAHETGVPVEAELGAVMGHEAGPLPPYEELFKSGRGFTDPQEATRFVKESGCDWLSVAIGNIHGAVSVATRDQKKVEARLNLEHLDRLRQATGIPLVLHGGSGVNQDNVLAAIRRGIAKVNVGTEIRQAYETALRKTGSVAGAQQATYERTSWVIKDYFGINGQRARLLG